MFNKHNTFLGIEANRDKMLRTQNWCLDLCVKKIVTFHEEAFDCCQKRWMMAPTAIWNREPFGAPNFSRVLPRVLKYVACVRTCGVRWMGLRFQFPTIWLPVEDYTPAYIISEYWWEEVLLLYGFKVPGTEMVEEYDLPHF